MNSKWYHIRNLKWNDSSLFPQEPIPYSFSYGVEDQYAGADFGQMEESDGHNVRGAYRVQLPDGRKQTVGL